MSIARKEDKQIISPAKAKRLLAFNTYLGQRKFSDKHASDLATKMVDGRFHTGQVAYVHFKGATRLVDGQHQLQACINADKPFVAMVHEWTLNGDSTEHNVAEIYSRYNVDRNRSRGDIAHAKASGMGWLFPAQIEQNLAAALSLLEDDNYMEGMDSRSTKTGRDETGDLFEANRKVCEWIAGLLIGQKNAKHMIRVPVMAAMIATYRCAQSQANQFWLEVRDGEGVDKSCMSYVLREFLKGVSIYCGGRNPQQKERADRRAVYAKSIHHWNAFRDGRQKAIRYQASAPLPKAV